MPSKNTKKNAKISKRDKVNNSGPANYPMSGIFDMGGMDGVAPLSQPFEFMNSTAYNLVSLQRVVLAYAYVMFGPLRTLVDQPVLDCFRGGVKVKSEELSPEDIEKLHKEMKKLKLVKAIKDGMRWDRLFGGAGIVINTDQTSTDPLDLTTINESTKVAFVTADRWELPWTGIPGAPNSTMTYGGYKLHQSRVIRIIGETPPSLVSARLQGWGMSVIECVLREMNMYLKHDNVAFEIMDEAKVDVWKIKGFNSQILSAAAAGKTAKRIQLATMMKNFLNAITLDSEDDYEQKTQSFTGLAEMMEQIRIGIAAAIRMPMAKIFGLAAKGFASGEDDIENYNAIVENERDKAIDLLEVTVPVLCMKLFGFVPDDLSFEFKSLRVLSAEQEEIVKDHKFQRHTSLYNSGIYTPQEYCDALKQDGILLIETEVSKGGEPMPPMQQQMLDQQDEDKSKDKDKEGDE